MCSAFRGYSGLLPCDIRCAAVMPLHSPNGSSPVKTAALNIPRAKMSAGFDCKSTLVESGGSIISGASHLEFAQDGEAIERSRWVLMGANP